MGSTPHLNPLPMRGEEIVGILFILLIPLSCLLKVFSVPSVVKNSTGPLQEGGVKILSALFPGIDLLHFLNGESLGRQGR